jgi:hypothetical protein
MRLQRDNSFIIADRILEKVEEYIKGRIVVDNTTFIWIDSHSLEVSVGNTDEKHTGEKIPISGFILEESGKLIPDYDQIDCCAASLR